MIEMHNPNGCILGISYPDEDEECFTILYASRYVDGASSKEAYIYEIIEAAYMVIFLEILKKEIKKEGCVI